MADFKDQWLNG